jgi:putative ABC transport system substrate-binding protein
MMMRREFIALLGGAAAWPLAARAQQPAMPVIGFLGASTPSNWATWTTAFVQGLRALGWVEGRTVKIEYRWAEGQSQRYAEIAAEFARLKVDVIVTVGSAVPAAKQATATIPIVFAAAIEPVESGLVASLVKPGGNVTGFSVQSIDLVGKRIEILRELLPDLRQLAVIADAGYSASMLEKDEVQSSARKFGIEVDLLAIRRAEDIAPVFETLKSGTQALYVCPSALVNANRSRINTWHLARDYQRYTVYVTLSVRVGSCLTAPIIRTCSCAQPSMSTKFSRAQSQPICRWSNQLSSSLSLI